MLKNYFSQTSSLKYSFLICLPLFAIYEMLIRISQPGTEAVVRLSTDIWFRNLLLLIHENTLVLSLIIITGLGIFIFIRERHRKAEYRLSFFGGMILESTIWAVILAFTIGWVIQQLFMMDAYTGVSRLQLLALSIGAGLYEELVFRVILVYALIFAFSYLFDRKTAIVISVIFSAALFSAVHYTGSFADNFTLASFFFRMLFGLAMNALLVTRGFGITAWTHSMYDVLLVMFFY